MGRGRGGVISQASNRTAPVITSDGRTGTQSRRLMLTQQTNGGDIAPVRSYESLGLLQRSCFSPQPRIDDVNISDLIQSPNLLDRLNFNFARQLEEQI